MAGNTFGTLFRITTFGESHGPGIGVVVDGCPAGLPIDLQHIQQQLNRRKPGQSNISTPRKEADEFELLSGVFEGHSTGAPIAFLVRNHDHKPEDYSHFEHTYRPGHADFTTDQKYGRRDHRGGGRSSARETIGRVIGGAIAQQLLQKSGIEIGAYVSRVGAVALSTDPESVDIAAAEENNVRCPDAAVAKEMIAAIEAVRAEGDSLGGAITCVIRHVPVGLGEPVFDKLQADLAKAMLSINAVKGFEIGDGFRSAAMRGSEHNDKFIADFDPNGHPRFHTTTNHSGGIQGGISNGAAIVFNVAFKPVSTIQQAQESVDREGNAVVLEGKGRHDPCVVPRAVPIVEAMAALVIADHLLRARSARV